MVRAPDFCSGLKVTPYTYFYILLEWHRNFPCSLLLFIGILRSKGKGVHGIRCIDRDQLILPYDMKIGKMQQFFLLKKNTCCFDKV